MMLKQLMMGCLIAVCLCTVFGTPVIAAEQPASQPAVPPQGNLTGFLAALQERGYDITAIENALADNDTNTVLSLLEQFRQDDRNASFRMEELPVNSSDNEMRDNLDLLDLLLKFLNRTLQRGYEVPAADFLPGNTTAELPADFMNQFPPDDYTGDQHPKNLTARGNLTDPVPYQGERPDMAFRNGAETEDQDQNPSLQPPAGPMTGNHDTARQGPERKDSTAESVMKSPRTGNPGSGSPGQEQKGAGGSVSPDQARNAGGAG